MLQIALAEIGIPELAIVGGVAITLFGIVFGTWKSRAQAREFEASRREIAAYVAEGSISPDDAERILKASPSEQCRRRP
ncbi:MAG: hypothetical protein IT439_11485 [Phycisphaerales bacterium]|nr:hypothetical protein [Phycisphaerales bacterium]